MERAADVPDFASLARDYLYRRDNIINPSLDGIRMLLAQLGDPHLKLQAIQVTGTNGKSSTAWMTEAILSAHGYKTAAYTSPHLVSFTERLRVNGADVSEALLAKHVARVGVIVDRLEASDGSAFSGFEIMTAACLDLLASEGVDVVVLEVGMGGRWDATSLVPAKIGAITHVALDHTEILGADKASIAAEKAYVFQTGRHCLTTECDPEMLVIFRERIEEIGEDELTIVDDVPPAVSRVRSPAAGEHQSRNLALALAIAEAYIGRGLEADKVSAALSALRLPGRLEAVDEEPLTILDGAHNPDAAERLAEWIAGWKSRAPAHKGGRGPVVVVLGILADKDAEGLVYALSRVADRIVATRPPSQRALSAELVADVARNATLPVDVEEDVAEAILMARRLAGAGGMVCVTGSLYTVGAAKALYAERGPTGP